jgi:hypothetical protein
MEGGFDGRAARGRRVAIDVVYMALSDGSVDAGRRAARKGQDVRPSRRFAAYSWRGSIRSRMLIASRFRKNCCGKVRALLCLQRETRTEFGRTIEGEGEGEGGLYWRWSHKRGQQKGKRNKFAWIFWVSTLCRPNLRFLYVPPLTGVWSYVRCSAASSGRQRFCGTRSGEILSSIFFLCLLVGGVGGARQNVCVRIRFQWTHGSIVCGTQMVRFYFLQRQPKTGGAEKPLLHVTFK